MKFHQSKGLTWTVLMLVAGGLCFGCGSPATVESYHPEEMTAKDALEKALTAWQNGEAQLIPGEPKIHVADERWVKGAKLKSFEIGEVLDEDGPAKFPVKLTFEGAAEPENETYMIIGKDPLWIMSKAESERSAGM
ncbi:MAG TPA: hypothetical protein VGM05_23435 [Planctomycetaceae bacterium]|jgi:hypothetical protein